MSGSSCFSCSRVEHCTNYNKSSSKILRHKMTKMTLLNPVTLVYPV